MTAQKSTVAEIKERFDQDVERFSNLETGQSATVDAPLCLELIAAAALQTNPAANHILDVGCGAGNFTLKLLEKLPNRNVTLVDLSRPMLARAEERIRVVSVGQIVSLQADIRDLAMPVEEYDIIVAAAVLHHLREDKEWEAVFAKLYLSLRPGGSLWISDLVTHSVPQIHSVMWARYGAYLASLKGPAYRDHVFSYIEKEDSPRPLTYQLDLLRKVGFQEVDVLHKNSCFAAFGGVKS